MRSNELLDLNDGLLGTPNLQGDRIMPKRSLPEGFETKEVHQFARLSLETDTGDWYL
jgi:hypothetical protein